VAARAAVRRVAVLQQLRAELRAELGHGGDRNRMRLLVRLGGGRQERGGAGRRQHPRQAAGHAVRVLLLPLHRLEARQMLVRRRLEGARELDASVDERVLQRLRRQIAAKSERRAGGTTLELDVDIRAKDRSRLNTLLMMLTMHANMPMLSTGRERCSTWRGVQRVPGSMSSTPNRKSTNASRSWRSSCASASVQPWTKRSVL